MTPIRTSDPMRTKNATRPSRPVSVKILGYIASTKGPPVMPVPQIGNFRHISNDCCHERSRSDVEVSIRSEEHTSELQSLAYLVCRLLLEKKKIPMSEHCIRRQFT